MIKRTFRAVSSYADWSFTDQIVDSDGDPLWSTPVPADLVVSFKLLPESARFTSDYGMQSYASPLIEASSDDGTGLITALVNGYFQIAVPRAQMRDLAPDDLDSALRYRVFVNVVTDDGSTQQLVATLPVYRGE